MKWRKITVHHSASPAVDAQGKLIGAKSIRTWHLNRGWRDIGYHFIILADGQVEKGRPITQQGAHCLAGSRNSIALGICLVGDFTRGEVPGVQLEGALELIKSLMERFKITRDNIELHRDVPGANTLCPGRFFPKDKFQRLLPGGVRT